jgi:hypothetical protein
MVWNSRLRVSVPDAARMAACASSSVTVAIRQSVCCTTMTRSTSSRWTARTRVRSTSLVTRPPAFRRIFASPADRPSISSGSMRESMQVTTASPRAACPASSPASNCAA